MEGLKRKPKDFKGITMDARGRSGGIDMLLKKGLDVSLLSISLNHVDVTVRELSGPGEWHFTGVYGHLENHNIS